MPRRPIFLVTYRTHSRPVHYLPIGRDATVSWGNFDMKFKNNTPAPIYVSYRTAGNAAIATLYGHKTSGQTVRLSVHSVKLGPRRISAALYRVIKRNGKLVAKEKIGRSEYNWKPGSGIRRAARRAPIEPSGPRTEKPRSHRGTGLLIWLPG